MKKDERELRIHDVAERINKSTSIIHTMLGCGMPDELKPKKTEYMASNNLAYSFTEQNIKDLETAFKWKEDMTYKEVKDLLEQRITLDRLDIKPTVTKQVKAKDTNENSQIAFIETARKEPSEGLINIDNKDGQLLVSSREIARNFNKRHDSLLRDIDNTISDMESPQNCGYLFIKTKYIHEQNKQEYQEYLLTRDGFSLLVMGFTGKKALQWKLKYIEAFNKMEQALMENRSSYMIDDPVERAKVWIKEQEQREELELKTKQQQQIIGELKPKSDYTDRILKSSDLVTITQISKDYGMSGQAMNTLLHDLEVQYKASGQWLLYKDYQDKGYTHSQTVEYVKANGSIGTNMHTKWTQKGRLFLYDLLKEKEVLPLIER